MVTSSNAARRPPIEIYYSYAPDQQDEKLRQKLERHLKTFERAGLITGWHAGKILAGSASDDERLHHLRRAQLILLLISSDFFNAQETYEIEMQAALERQARGEACVILILLRPVVLVDQTPLTHLEALPDNGRPVTSWPRQDEAFANIANGLKRVLERLSQEPVAAVASRPLSSTQKTSFQTQRSTRSTLSASPTISDRFTPFPNPLSRERMLKLVHTSWIEGVLEQWLRGTVFIDLHLHDTPAAINNPWQSIMQETRRVEEALPDDTRIIDIYDQVDGILLILGKPGAGKTGLLLDLLRQLLQRAGQDSMHPLPVFFNLASWGQKQAPLDTWIIEELTNRYFVPSTMARDWVNELQVLPLLDGLDTVPSHALSACVLAINKYRQKYDVPLVVCSRNNKYMEQPVRLVQGRAVMIQPLNEHQTEHYLSGTNQSETLRTAITSNEALYMQATTPFMLSLLRQVYQEIATGKVQGMKYETFQSILFPMYIKSVLSRGKENKAYPHSLTVSWLAYLARQMERHSQIIFSQEYIQPDWLAGMWPKLIYYTGNGLIGALLSGIALGLVGYIAGGQTVAIVAGLVGALIGGTGFLFAARKIQFMRTTQNSSLRRQAGSLLYSFVLWLLVLLTHASGGFSETFITVIILLSLPFLLVGELLKKRSGAVLDDISALSSGSALRQSLQNGIHISLLIGTGLASLTIIFQLFAPLKGDLISYWLLVILLALLGGLLSGALAVFQLKLVYWLLRRNSLMPKDYISFLDYAVEHSLLSKAGGGYMFRYPHLQDYFTSSSIEQEISGPD